MHQVSIGSSNRLSPVRRQAITRTNTGFLWIGPLETIFDEIRIEIPNWSLMRMWLNMSYAKLRPSYPGEGSWCISAMLVLFRTPVWNGDFHVWWCNCRFRHVYSAVMISLLIMLCKDAFLLRLAIIPPWFFPVMKYCFFAICLTFPHLSIGSQCSSKIIDKLAEGYKMNSTGSWPKYGK